MNDDNKYKGEIAGEIELDGELIDIDINDNMDIHDLPNDRIDELNEKPTNNLGGK